MDLEEVRRRNRRRIGSLAVVSAVNYWIIASLVAATFGWWVIAKLSDNDTDLPPRPFAVGGAAVAAVIVVGSMVGKVFGCARATVNELGAEVIDGDDHQRLRNLSQELALAAGIDPVKVAILDDPVPNALTVGAGRRSTVVVTTGLLDQLARDELEAVLAVQMCAIRRLDVALQTVVVASAAGAASIHHTFREDWKDPRAWIWIAVTWPSWMVAEVVRRAVFRQRDTGADDMAVQMTRHPEALRRALGKLLADPGVVAAVTPSNAPLWFEPMPAGAHLAAEDRERYAMAPLIEDRIARLS